MGLSIVGVTAAEPPWWVWAGWLIAAVAMALVFARRRPRAPALELAEERSARQVVPLLAVTGLLSFCVWIGVQIVYVSVRRPTLPGPATLPTVAVLSSADLVRLSLISGLTAWAVAIGLLNMGRGIRAIGYGFRRIPNGLVAGTIGIFIAIPVVYYALQITLWALAKLQVTHPDQHELLRVIDHDPEPWVRSAAVLSAVLAAPLFEELLFRGCIQGGLRRATRSGWIGILVASGLFVSLHAAWTMPPLLVFSILLGVVYERTRNLWATTVMHALFNAFSIIVSGMS